ncbi:hypothetical protein HNQ65_004031 [Prosthecobacter vanneervenii]|uniref:Uncharacterized protein n=1 Tax=Prosthecobacter vanneervenii TaxID=48466 RepID=A0A7W7YEB6_9BACT|nr:hypothetical protein [Prosthecobacter vanneervenii]
MNERLESEGGRETRLVLHTFMESFLTLSTIGIIIHDANH